MINVEMGKPSFLVLAVQMSEKIIHKLTEKEIEAIERVVNRGQRAEVVPVKDGLKILRVVRQEEK